MPIFGRELVPYSEFIVCLQQIIPAQIVGNAVSTLSNGLRITFGFENLYIEVNTLGVRKQITRLPLWEGVTIGEKPAPSFFWPSQTREHPRGNFCAEQGAKLDVNVRRVGLGGKRRILHKIRYAALPFVLTYAPLFPRPPP